MKYLTSIRIAFVFCSFSCHICCEASSPTEQESVQSVTAPYHNDLRQIIHEHAGEHDIHHIPEGLVYDMGKAIGGYHITFQNSDNITCGISAILSSVASPDGYQNIVFRLTYTLTGSSSPFRHPTHVSLVQTFENVKKDQIELVTGHWVKTTSPDCKATNSFKVSVLNTSLDTSIEFKIHPHFIAIKPAKKT